MDLQEFVAKWYASKGYNAGAVTLMLGVMEEVGELAEAILLTQVPDFQCSPHKQLGIDSGERRINVSGEVGDVIIYLMALCNSLGIRPYIKGLTADVKILVEATEVHQ